MNENPNLITITQERYNELLKAEYNLEALEKILFTGVSLNYRRDALSFDGDYANLAVNLVFRETAQLKFTMLKEMEGEEE